MYFSDIHLHILYGTDDGAKTIEEMYKMVDMAYNDGTRLICATPHFHPDYFDDNRESSLAAFNMLCAYCGEKYPDLALVLGNEVAYRNEFIPMYKTGVLRPYGETRYTLVEFPENTKEEYISEAIDRLLNVGYIPIIAHAERYYKLRIGCMKVFKESGVLIQANAQSMFKGYGFRVRNRMKSMLKNKIVDFISTDAHDLVYRPPIMSKGYKIIAEKYGEEYANEICYEKAQRLLCPSEGK
jgi:protein-tyrosine phosphatase